jgi:hypothetical protein
VAKPRLKPIPGFACYYADDSGHIWTAKPSRWGHVNWAIRRPGIGRDGYPDVVLIRSNGRKANKPVHVLVASAFHGPRPAGLLVAHNNGIKLDCRPSNLAYKTPKENSADARTHGVLVVGEHSHLARLKSAQVMEIKQRAIDGEPRKSLASEFGVGISTVDAIKSGRRWAHLESIVH